MNRNSLFLRALFAFLVLPGVVAFAVPLLLLRPAMPAHAFALGAVPVLVLGVGLLWWCVREFYLAGRGTLAPWAPPRYLVTSGPYRYSRNPMYLGVLLILAGWAIGFRSGTLGLYAAIMAVAFHVRVRWYEEPWLARKHGEKWDAYATSARRWLIRRPQDPRPNSRVHR